MEYFWLAILLVLGLAMIIKPHVLWKIEHILTVEDGEPTALYLNITRAFGVFFVLAAIVIAILRIVRG